MHDKAHLAMAFAMQAHKDQMDKLGKPYLGHVLRVAARCADDAQALTAALLHDVVEDSPIDLGIIEAGFGEGMARTVDCLTKRKNESLTEYCARVKSDPCATRVKIADLTDNMDPIRLRELDSETRNRLLNKYQNCMEAIHPFLDRP